MPGLLSWFTSWLDSTGPDSDDQTLTDLNVAINNTIIKTRSEMADLISSNLTNGSGAIIKLHYDDCIEQTLRRFLDLSTFSTGDVHSVRQRLVDCETLKTLDLHDNEWDTQSVDQSISQSDDRMSALVDGMLSVYRSWIKLDVLDGDVQQALLIICEEVKNALIKALVEQITSINQTANQLLIRVCLRVPTLNTICVLLIGVESINQSIQVSHLSSRVTLFDQFSNEQDCQSVNQVLHKLETSNQTFQDAQHRASTLHEIKADVF